MSLIQIADEKPLNIYRTEIPNIVFDIGLTCFELALYAHLRRTAGPGGQCTKGVRRLSEETGMSTGNVSEIRRKLCEPRPELGGKPLIRVEEVQDPKCKVRHFVTIVDIWRENFDRFDRVQVVNTPVHGVNTPCSSGEQKKEPNQRKKVADAPDEETELQVHLPVELDSDEFLEAIDLWISERKKKRIKAYTQIGLTKLLKDLAQMGQERAIAAINHSIAQGYNGIYEAKSKATNGHSNGSSNRNAGTFNEGRASAYKGVERLA